MSTTHAVAARMVLKSLNERIPTLETLCQHMRAHPAAYATARAANRVNAIPTNHSPQFLPVLHPTLKAGVEALVVGACGWLAA